MDLQEMLDITVKQLERAKAREPMLDDLISSSMDSFNVLATSLADAERAAIEEEANNARAKAAIGNTIVKTAKRYAEQSAIAEREKDYQQQVKQAELDNIASALGLNPVSSNYIRENIASRIRDAQSQQAVLLDSIAKNKKVGLVDGIGEWINAQFQMQDDFADLRSAMKTEDALTAHLNALERIMHDATVNIGSLIPKQSREGAEAELEAKKLKNELEILQQQERITGISTAATRAYRIAEAKYRQVERQLTQAMQFADRNSDLQRRLVAAQIKLRDEISDLQSKRDFLEHTENIRSDIAKQLNIAPEAVTNDMINSYLRIKMRPIRSNNPVTKERYGEAIRRMNTDNVYSMLGSSGAGVDDKMLNKIAPSVPAFGTLGGTLPEAVVNIRKLSEAGLLDRLTPTVRSILEVYDAEANKLPTVKEEIGMKPSDVLAAKRERYGATLMQEAADRLAIKTPLLKMLSEMPSLVNFEEAAKKPDVQMGFALEHYKKVDKKFIEEYKENIGKGRVSDSLRGLLDFTREKSREDLIDLASLAKNVSNLAQALNTGRAGYQPAKIFGMDADFNKRILVTTPDGKQLDLADPDNIVRYLLETRKPSFLGYLMRPEMAFPLP